MLIILQSTLILVYFQVNNLLPLVLVQKEFFSKFGIPKKVMRDNGSEYLGKDYKLLAKPWTSNMTHLALIIQDIMGKLNKLFKR